MGKWWTLLLTELVYYFVSFGTKITPVSDFRLWEVLDLKGKTTVVVYLSHKEVTAN